MRPRLADKGDDWNVKRQQVLEVAAALFAQHGVDAVSMRDIGRASGLHMSTLYYYFPSKAEIYGAACHWAFERVCAETMKALEIEGSPEERLEEFTRSAVRFLIEDNIAARILDQHFIFGGTLWDSFDYPRIAREPTYEIGRILVAVRSPILSALTPDRAGEIMWDVIYGIARFAAAHTAVNPEDNPDPRDWRRIAAEAWLAVRRMML